MKIRVPSYFKEFSCIASECEDTCCAGWDVVIDAETYQRYQDMEGAFGEKIRSKMAVDDDGDHIFILEGIRCPFLNTGDLCDIYKEKGEQYLCHTCQQYPRYMEEFGDLREVGISLSCPEAARLILGHDSKLSYELSEDDQTSSKIPEDEKDLLEVFFQCRTTIMDLLDMPDWSLGLRMSVVLKFVEELQDKLDFDEMDALQQVRETYSQSSYLMALVQEFKAYKGHEVSKYNDVYEYFKTYRDLEHINENDPLGLCKVLVTYWNGDEGQTLYMNQHKAFNDYYKDQMADFEKILGYFIYRYFMKSFYDFDMSSKIKVAVMSTIMIKELAVVKWVENGAFYQADMVELSHSYSKDIEHLEANIDTLENIFESMDLYSFDRLISTLMNEF